MHSKSTTKLRIIVWGCVYWVLLSFCFVYPMQVNYATVEWQIEFNYIKYIIATAAALPMLYLSAENDGVTGLFLLILLYLVVLPIGVIYAFQDQDTAYYLSIAACFCLVAAVIRRMSVSDLSVSIHGGSSKTVILAFSGVILALSLMSLFLQRGMPTLGALRLLNVYEIRSSYTLSSITSALFSIATKAVVPFLLAYCFIKKHYKAIVLLLMLQLLFYLWLAHKTTVFSIGIFVIGYLIIKAKNSSMLFSKSMCFGVLAISLPEVMSGVFSGIIKKVLHLAFSLIVRRTIFVPASLKYSYYDFFVVKRNPTIGLFGTLVAPILTRVGVEMPYDGVPFTQVIGNIYANGSNANTGMFGTELAHFGYLGIPIAAIFLLIFLICVKKSETVNGAVFTCCVSLFTIIELANTGAIDMIAFSPMLFIAVILFFFNMNAAGTEEMVNKTRIIRFEKRRIRFRP